METESTKTEAVDATRVVEAPQPYEYPAWVYPCLWILPGCLWLEISAFATLAFSQGFHLTFWLAAFLGLVFGTAVFAFWLLVMRRGETWEEINVEAVMGIMLVGILFPVFLKAREKAMQQNHKTIIRKQSNTIPLNNYSLMSKGNKLGTAIARLT